MHVALTKQRQFRQKKLIANDYFVRYCFVVESTSSMTLSIPNETTRFCCFFFNLWKCQMQIKLLHVILCSIHSFPVRTDKLKIGSINSVLSTLNLSPSRRRQDAERLSVLCGPI